MDTETVVGAKNDSNQTSDPALEKSSSTPHYKLSDLITLFVNQTTIINSLWGIYAAAQFAAAGFGATSKADFIARLAITFGYWVFLTGHLVLLVDALRTVKSLSSTIIKTVDASGNGDIPVEFAEALKLMAQKAKCPWKSVVIHMVINTCVTIVIWNYAFASTATVPSVASATTHRGASAKTPPNSDTTTERQRLMLSRRSPLPPNR